MTISAGTTRPGVPRGAWGFTWLLAALCAGIPGWLVFALSERPDGRLTGGILLGVAVLGAVTAAAVMVYRARRLSLVTSAVFVLAGAAVGAITVAGGNWFVSDLLLLGGLPVVGGIVTVLLARR